MPITLNFIRGILAALHGALFSLLPISWIVITALFLYDLTVRSHAFDIVKAVLLSLSPDKRMQCLVIAYLFGGFLEGAAGFSTPVALAAAMLTGMNFGKVEAASLALLANTIPVSFGALGTPILVIPEATGFEIGAVARAVGRLQVPFSLFVPWMVVYASCGSLALTLEAWPALLTTSLSYTAMLVLTTEFMGARPVSVVASLVALVCVAGLLRVWQPATVVRAGEKNMGQSKTGGSNQNKNATAKGDGDSQVIEVEMTGSANKRRSERESERESGRKASTGDGANAPRVAEISSDNQSEDIGDSNIQGPSSTRTNGPGGSNDGDGSSEGDGEDEDRGVDAEELAVFSPSLVPVGSSLDDDIMDFTLAAHSEAVGRAISRGLAIGSLHDAAAGVSRRSIQDLVDASGIAGALVAGPSPLGGVFDVIQETVEEDQADESSGAGHVTPSHEPPPPLWYSHKERHMPAGEESSSAFARGETEAHGHTEEQTASRTAIGSLRIRS